MSCVESRRLYHGLLSSQDSFGCDIQLRTSRSVEAIAAAADDDGSRLSCLAGGDAITTPIGLPPLSFPKYDVNKSKEVAVRVGPRSITFGELACRSYSLGLQFLDGGALALPAGSIVAYIATAELEVPELLMAAAGSGIRALAIPDVLTPAEIKTVLSSYPVSLLFCARSFYDGASVDGDESFILSPSWLPSDLSARVVLWDGDGGKTSCDTISSRAATTELLNYESVIGTRWQQDDASVATGDLHAQVASRANAQRSRPQVTDDFVYFLTSGTTGVPKVVRTTYATMTPKFFSPTAGDDDRAELCVSYQSQAWIGGVAMSLGLLYNGVPVVQMRGYDARLYLDLIRKYRPTTLCWLPMAMEDMTNLSEADAAEINRMVTRVTYGGACFPMPLVRRAMEMFPDIDITQVYGSTEVSVICMLTRAQHETWFAHLDRCSSSLSQQKAPAFLPAAVVRPDDPNRLSVVDLTTGRDKLAGLSGSVVVHSSTGSNGYLNMPERNAELFVDPSKGRDGGYITGDRGHFLDFPLDPNNPNQFTRLLFIEGREKDTVITRVGYCVSMAEVANASRLHPQLTELPVAVAGVKDAQGAFDEVCLWIAAPDTNDPELSPKAISDFLRDNLAEYKVPTHIRVVAELPVNRNGKIDLNKLRASFKH